MAQFNPADMRVFTIKVKVQGHRLLEDNLPQLLAAYIEDEDVLRLVEIQVQQVEEMVEETQDLPLVNTSDIRSATSNKILGRKRQ